MRIQRAVAVPRPAGDAWATVANALPLPSLRGPRRLVTEFGRLPEVGSRLGIVDERDRLVGTVEVTRYQPPEIIEWRIVGGDDPLLGAAGRYAVTGTQPCRIVLTIELPIRLHPSSLLLPAIAVVLPRLMRPVLVELAREVIARPVEEPARPTERVAVRMETTPAPRPRPGRTRAGEAPYAVRIGPRLRDDLVERGFGTGPATRPEDAGVRSALEQAASAADGSILLTLRPQEREAIRRWLLERADELQPTSDEALQAELAAAIAAVDAIAHIS